MRTETRITEAMSLTEAVTHEVRELGLSGDPRGVGLIDQAKQIDDASEEESMLGVLAHSLRSLDLHLRALQGTLTPRELSLALSDAIRVRCDVTRRLTRRLASDYGARR